MIVSRLIKYEDIFVAKHKTREPLREDCGHSLSTLEMVPYYIESGCPLNSHCLVLACPLSPLHALVTPSAGEGHMVQDLSAEITELLVSYYQER